MGYLVHLTHIKEGTAVETGVLCLPLGVCSLYVICHTLLFFHLNLLEGLVFLGGFFCVRLWICELDKMAGISISE